MNLFGQPVVILNSAKQAKAMLDTKSNIYSDRPILQMGRLIGWSEGVAMMPYGQSQREQRRYMHSSIGSKILMVKHHGVLIDETSKFLKRMLSGGSEGLDAQIRRYVYIVFLVYEPIA